MDAIRVLVIEDSDADARLVEERLHQIPGGSFVLVRASRLSEGLARLEHSVFDVVLLDLRLPDATDWQSAIRTLLDACGVPVVVLTGGAEEGVAESAIRLGASEYLLKSELTPRTLHRAIRYARARHALATAEQEREWLERELRALERFGGLLPAPITARMYGERRLYESAPEVFGAAADAYAKLLEAAVEASVFAAGPPAATRVRELAVQLARCFAGPGDIVEVHTAALTARMSGATPARVRAYVSEGRLLLLELMGRVLSVYRSGTLGVAVPSPTAFNPEPRGPEV